MNNDQLALEVFRHYQTVNPELKHYYGLLSIYGLLHLAESGCEEARVLAESALLRFPDDIEHPRYNFPSYRIGGNARARAVWNGTLAGDEEKAQLREFAEEMMTAQRSREGILSMPREGGKEKVWIDTCMPVGIYLLYAGLALKEQRYLDEAVFQVTAMHDLLLDPDCGLLHQARGFFRPGQITRDHWSRGNGWAALPLAELAVRLPKDHPGKAECASRLRDLMAALLPWQTENGLWRQEITLEVLGTQESYEETSGTALILYAMGLGIRHGLLEQEVYLPRLKKGIAGLKQMGIGENFAILNTCPGCLAPLDGSILAYLEKRSYPDEPHGAGPVIMALAEARNNGLL